MKTVLAPGAGILDTKIVLNTRAILVSKMRALVKSRDEKQGKHVVLSCDLGLLFTYFPHGEPSQGEVFSWGTQLGP